MLRAFARSETQAHTDPLTGLLNRRSLEARTRDLTDEGLPFVVAYGDLDQFKLLNDVHGHDTGDRALRLFARVLRDSVRPNDIPARYGGEEFVAVLPDCSIDNAVIVIERIRTRLRTALTDGTVPPFTVSFGLAASESRSHVRRNRRRRRPGPPTREARRPRPHRHRRCRNSRRRNHQHRYAVRGHAIRLTALDMSAALQRNGAVLAYPWTLCARVVGSKLDFKVWPSRAS